MKHFRNEWGTVQLILDGARDNPPTRVATKNLCVAAIAMLAERALTHLRMAVTSAQLDADLLDLSDDAINAAGYCLPLNVVRIDTMYYNDDHAENNTRFTKDELRWLLEFFQLDEWIWIPQNSMRQTGKYYKFHREELLIYALHKNSTKKTHKDMAEDPRFGGSDGRWIKGHRWLLLYMRERCYHLIGSDAIEMWVRFFPQFADRIYDYMLKPKDRYRRDGTHYQVCWNHPGAPTREQFNVASFTDVKAYEICRPGSGPAHPDEGSPRRPNAYLNQRAFWDPHHHCHTIKILSIQLPNGMSGAVHGPTSGFEVDDTILDWSGLDYKIRDLCIQHFGNRIYTSYADAIFGGYWYSFRTRFEPLPALNLPLTFALENENDNLKSGREFHEHGYGFVIKKFPGVAEKECMKLMLDSELIFAKVIVFHFLANVLVCLREGNTCTGERAFACTPPKLQEYLNGAPYSTSQP